MAEHPWLVGDMNIPTSGEVLRRQYDHTGHGCFLVRNSTSSPGFSITICDNHGLISHRRIARTVDGFYEFAGFESNDIVGLIDRLRREGVLLDFQPYTNN